MGSRSWKAVFFLPAGWWVPKGGFIWGLNRWLSRGLIEGLIRWLNGGLYRGLNMRAYWEAYQGAS